MSKEEIAIHKVKQKDGNAAAVRMCDHITRECEEGAEMEETDHNAKIVEDVNENDTKLKNQRAIAGRTMKRKTILFTFIEKKMV